MIEKYLLTLIFISGIFKTSIKTGTIMKSIMFSTSLCTGTSVAAYAWALLHSYLTLSEIRAGT